MGTLAEFYVVDPKEIADGLKGQLDKASRDAVIELWAEWHPDQPDPEGDFDDARIGPRRETATAALVRVFGQQIEDVSVNSVASDDLAAALGAVGVELPSPDTPAAGFVFNVAQMQVLSALAGDPDSVAGAISAAAEETAEEAVEAGLSSALVIA